MKGNATRKFCPRAICPLSDEETSASNSPFLTFCPGITIGRCPKHVKLFVLWKLIKGYSIFFPFEVSRTIFRASELKLLHLLQLELVDLNFLEQVLQHL
jgi:hypothetical protein